MIRRIFDGPSPTPLELVMLVVLIGCIGYFFTWTAHGFVVGLGVGAATVLTRRMLLNR